ncbi:alpha/beta hydrolase [Catenuloplanes sp. NPDC051500]|uniref:alpha/beta hydrolase n=1 Tax=Catenuloplanes sp. NPDC051500 TaxID=3363959 RepID=UPI0037B71480
MTRIVALVAVAATAGLAAISPASAHPGQCTRRLVTVTLTDGRDAPRYRLATWLCKPRRASSVVQVLMSGFTYDHHYWINTGYAQEAIRAGHAVLYVDRIGVGESDRPPADQVTADTEAYVAHQLVQRLRGEHRFRTVVGVGHSYGSLVWAAEAYRFDDVDAFVLTGFMHAADVPTQLMIRAHLYPAGADPRFAHVPDGYLTTMPDFRRQAYLYRPGTTDRMVDVDERMKVTGTTGELASLKNLSDPAYTSGIRRPVLLQMGTNDALFCNALTGISCATPAELCRRERALFPRTPLSATVVRDTGHTILYHRASWQATVTAIDWIDHTVRRAPAPRAVINCG